MKNARHSFALDVLNFIYQRKIVKKLKLPLRNTLKIQTIKKIRLFEEILD